MGMINCLVIGDDVEKQLKKFKHTSAQHPLSRHIVATDVLNKAKKAYAKEQLEQQKQKEPQLQEFLPWVLQEYEVNLLAPGASPDLKKQHRFGWVRLNAAGKVSELIRRLVPHSFHYHLWETRSRWVLKPGAVGYSFGNYCHFPWKEIGMAGSARRGDIDIEGMYKRMRMRAGQRWDQARQACGTTLWQSHRVFKRRYENAERLLTGCGQIRALRRWMQQDAVKIIRNQSAPKFSPDARYGAFDIHLERYFWDEMKSDWVDRFLLPRQEYVEKFGVLPFMPQSIVKDGVKITITNEKQFFDALPNHTWLHYVYLSF